MSGDPIGIYRAFAKKGNGSLLEFVYIIQIIMHNLRFAYVRLASGNSITDNEQNRKIYFLSALPFFRLLTQEARADLTCSWPLAWSV